MSVLPPDNSNGLDAMFAPDSSSGGSSRPPVGAGAPADIASPGSAGASSVSSFASSGSGLGGSVTPPAPVAAVEAEKPKPAKADTGGGGMLSNLRVSLMPSDLEGRPAPNLARGLLLLGIVFAAETVIIGFAYFLVSRSVTARVAERDRLLAQITQVDKEIAALEASAKPAVAYYFQLANAAKTLDGHVYWTAFFSFLEKNTLNSIQYVSFSGDASTGVISLDAMARTYRDAAEQIVSLRENPMVLSVQSTSASASVDDLGNVGGISFAMNVRLKTDIWHKYVTAAAAAAPTPAQVQAAPVVPAPAPVETPTPAEVPAATPPETETETDVAAPPVAPTEGVVPPDTTPENPATAPEPAAPTPPETP